MRMKLGVLVVAAFLMASCTRDAVALTVVFAGAGKGTVTIDYTGRHGPKTAQCARSNCGLRVEGVHVEDDHVFEVTAVPDPGSVFVRWSGCSSSTSPTTIAGSTGVSSDDKTVLHSCTATFAPITADDFTVAVAGTGTGTVTYRAGSASTVLTVGQTQVFHVPATNAYTFTVAPDAGSRFAGWTGDCIGADAVLAGGEVNPPASCTATIDRVPPAVVGPTTVDAGSEYDGVVGADRSAKLVTAALPFTTPATVSTYLLLDDGRAIRIGGGSWANAIAGSVHAEGLALAGDDDGNHYVAGSYGDYGGEDGWVTRVSAAGDFDWNVSIDTGRSEALQAILPTGDGGAWVAGRRDHSQLWLAKVGPDGSILSSKVGPDVDHVVGVVPSDDGGVYVAGSILGIIYDVFVARFDADGGLVWFHTLWADGDQDASGLARDADQLYVVGASQSDAFALATDLDGNPVWGHTYGGDGAEDASGVVVTADGLAVVGSWGTDANANADLLAFTLGTDGTLGWVDTYGGDGDDRGGVIVPTDDGFALAGAATSFPPDPEAATLYDAWSVPIDGAGGVSGCTSTVERGAPSGTAAIAVLDDLSIEVFAFTPTWNDTSRQVATPITDEPVDETLATTDQCE
jgi:hypothetical protein